MITLTTLDHTPRLAELKVSYRRARGREAQRRKTPCVLNTPVTAEKYLRSVWDEDTFDLREEFLLVCLNTALDVLGWVRLAAGGMSSTDVDPRLVFGVALSVAASGILVAHNHPSGSVRPSSQDEALTRRLKAGAELLNLRFVDHVILGRDAAYSFAGEGLI